MWRIQVNASEPKTSFKKVQRAKQMIVNGLRSERTLTSTAYVAQMRLLSRVDHLVTLDVP